MTGATPLPGSAMPNPIVPVIVPVVLSGDTGIRLWPVSIPAPPKQFLALGGETTLTEKKTIFAATFDCVAAKERAETIITTGYEMLTISHGTSIVYAPREIDAENAA